MGRAVTSARNLSSPSTSSLTVRVRAEKLVHPSLANRRSRPHDGSMPVQIRNPWHLAERELTPEKFFHQRRQLIKSAGLIGFGMASGMLTACGPAEDAVRIGGQENPPGLELY